MAAVLERIGLLVVSIVLTLFAAEGIVRLLAPAPPSPASHQHYYRADAEMGYDIAPDFPRTPEEREDHTTRQMWSNKLGCFDTGVRPGTPYVLLLGDSFTHGSTRFEDNWTPCRPPAARQVQNDIVAGFLNERRLAHLDLLPVLRAHADVTPRASLDPVRDLYYRVDFHFNRRGNVLAGLAVAEHIAERRLCYR